MFSHEMPKWKLIIPNPHSFGWAEETETFQFRRQLRSLLKLLVRGKFDEALKARSHNRLFIMELNALIWSELSTTIKFNSMRFKC